MAGNPPVPGRPLPYVRTLYRLLAVAVLLAVLILRLFDGIDFYAIRAEVTDRVVSAHLGLADSAAAYPEGADAHPERIVAGLNRAFDLALTWIPRGIMLAALVFVMFINRQLSFLVSRLFRKRRAGDLTGFFAPKRTVWVFAAALPVILLGRTLPAPFVEIVAWNVLVACALVFLAQGGGIVLFNLSRRSMPVPVRVILAVVFVVIMFVSPVNLFVLGALLILGVAENWFPMRRAEPEAPA